jgi:hypothetical protein
MLSLVSLSPKTWKDYWDVHLAFHGPVLFLLAFFGLLILVKLACCWAKRRRRLGGMLSQVLPGYNESRPNAAKAR